MDDHHLSYIKKLKKKKNIEPLRAFPIFKCCWFELVLGSFLFFYWGLFEPMSSNYEKQE